MARVDVDLKMAEGLQTTVRLLELLELTESSAPYCCSSKGFLEWNKFIEDSGSFGMRCAEEK